MRRKIPRWLRDVFFFTACCCWRGGRPRNMFPHGRQLDNSFEATEQLFFRWFGDHLEGEAIRPANLPIPDQSVNRAKHGGRPWYVLIPDPEPNRERTMKNVYMGVVEIQVRCIPPPYQMQKETYTFRAEHDPLPYNYHHCEIRVYRNGQRVKDPPPKEVRKFYRTELARDANIILLPEIATKASASQAA